MKNIFFDILVVLCSLLKGTQSQTEILYQTIDLTFPMSVFPIDLQAGDVLYLNLTWDRIVDLDLYVYEAGMDLMDTSNYLQRGYGVVNYVQQFSYTAAATTRYYMSVECYTYADLNTYKLEASVNGQFRQFFYDIVEYDKSIGVKYFTISNTCKAHIVYTGPAWTLTLYSVNGSYNLLSSTANQFVIQVTVGGTFGIHINHGMTSAYTIQTGQIKIYYYIGDTCTSFCSSYTKTNGLQIGTNNVCQCTGGYQWDTVNTKCSFTCANIMYAIPSKKTTCNCIAGYKWISATNQCVVDCSLIAYASALAPGQINQCTCSPAPEFVWDFATLKCIINCSSIAYAMNFVPAVVDQCGCTSPSHMVWSATTFKCIVDCTTVTNAVSMVSGTIDQCTCAPSALFNWIIPFTCQINCTQIRYSTGITAGTSNQCDCQTLPLFNWDPLSYACVIDCSLIMYTSTVLAGTVDICSCSRLQFKWNAIQSKCIINCSSIMYTAAPLTGTIDACLCMDGYNWSPTLYKCQINCSLISYAVSLVPGSADQCTCDMSSIFVWNINDFRCQIDCALIPYANNLTSIDVCTCTDPLFYWNVSSFQCIIDCSLVQYASTSANNTIDQCQCQSNKFYYNISDYTCTLNCSAIANSAPNQTSISSCDCDPTFKWNPSALECQLQSNNQINIQILHIEKSDSSNQITILFQLTPVDNIDWSNFDLLNSLSLTNNSGFDSITIVKDENGQGKIIINYNKDIQNLDLNLSIDFSKSGILELQNFPPIINSFKLTPTDNQLALYYDQQVYQMAGMISGISSAIGGATLFVFFAALMVNKIIGIQLIGVIQITYLSLLSVPSQNPCVKALSRLWMSIGFNYFSLTKQYQQDKNSPIPAKGLQLHSQFMYNYNSTIIFIVIPIMVSLVLALLSKTVYKNDKQKQSKLVRMSKNCFCEFGFVGVMFSSYIVYVCLLLEIFYGMKGGLNLRGIISLIVCGFSVLAWLGYLAMLIKIPMYFGDFVSSFKGGFNIVNQKTQQKQQNQLPQSGRQISKQTSSPQRSPLIDVRFYVVIMIYSAVVGSSFVALLNFQMSSAVPIALSLILAVIVFIRKPYLKQYHNYRFVANMLIIICISAIYLCYKKIPLSQQLNKNIWYYLPIGICGLLGICLTYNVVIFIYQIYHQIKKRCGKMQNDEIDKQFEEEMKKLSKMDSMPQRKVSLLQSSIPLSPSNNILTSSIQQAKNLQNLRRQIKAELKMKQNQEPTIQNKIQDTLKQIKEEQIQKYNLI